MSASRGYAKQVLQQVGLFPVARSLYRSVNPTVRAQKSYEARFYGNLLKPNSLCFDVGANLGQKAEIFRLCGARVVAVEPNYLCHPTLTHLFGHDKNVQIVSSAVGSSNGHLDLYVHGTDATGSARPEWHQQVYGNNQKTRALKVPVTTIDSLIDRYGRPDFVKIDVEGFEIDVLNGMSSAVPLLSFEYHSNELSRARTCLELLRKLAPLSVRASNMACEWITDQLEDVDLCLQKIADAKEKGDLFVWMQ
jgi:FkbM family methyltransferase